MKTITISIFEKGVTYRKGHIYNNGKLIAISLEPTDRNIVPGNVQSEMTVNNYRGQCAIPYGTYEGKVEWSPINENNVVWLQNVPYFQGIEMHIGNSSKDTKGCILLGCTELPSKDWIGYSGAAFSMFMVVIRSFAPDPFQITINDDEWQQKQKLKSLV